jgi:hypothetical protein
MPKKAPVKTSSAPASPALNPHAAGIDIGATAIYVAVPAEQDPAPWLRKCGIRTVAMEATGVYSWRNRALRSAWSTPAT